MTSSQADVAATLLDLAQRRGAGRTFCPSEAARALSEDWRPLMPVVRETASDLQNRGLIAATQRGIPVDPVSARGPIRLGLPKAGA